MDTEDTVNFLPLIKYTSCHSVEQWLWRQFWLSGLTWEEGDEAEHPVFSGQDAQMLLISDTHTGQSPKQGGMCLTQACQTELRNLQSVA